jgi:hypothetical protein
MTVIEKNGTLHKLSFKDNKPQGDVHSIPYGGEEFFAKKLDERDNSISGPISHM